LTSEPETRHEEEGVSEEFEPEAEGDRLDVDFDRRLPEFWVSLRLTSEPETRHEEEEDFKRIIRTRRFRA